MKSIIVILCLFVASNLRAEGEVTTSTRSGFVLRHFTAGDTSTAMLVVPGTPKGAVTMFVGEKSLNSLRISAGFPHEIVSQSIEGIAGLLCIRFYSKATQEEPSHLMEVLVVQSDRGVRFASDREFQTARAVEPDRELAAEAHAKALTEKKAAEPGATDNPGDAQ